MGKVKPTSATRNMRNLMGILKDKVSVLKAVLSLSSSSSLHIPTPSLHVAVIRATTHHPIDPPPDDTDTTLLEISHYSSTAVVAALLRRLHRTSSVLVALKCLIALHRVLPRAALPPVDHLVHLSAFRDTSDHVTWELSSWARWFADVIEHRHFLSQQKLHSTLSPPKELTSLVSFVQLLSRAPETLHYQKMSLIYEVMKLVCEDYRVTLREISSRVKWARERVDDVDDEALCEVLKDMKRLEECKEKLFRMFLNKKRNDGVWEMIGETRKEVEREVERREGLRLVEVSGREIVPVTRGRRWLDVEWNTLAVAVV